MTLYQDQILDHYRNPRNYGSLDRATHRADTRNPTCGDALHMDIIVQNGTISDVRFTGSGCAISQASASLLSGEVRGKRVVDILAMEPATVLKLLGVPLSPNRMKCGLLSLETLHKTLTHEIVLDK